ncbi:DUF3048 domain-containing protein [Sporosarcina sp. YIM B06819]|uniref:DUF3048 domain-containing protein n=1 Tax=Sporosarcina sp. YIM B06819 TaxID=3081769 RepID=UPI00298CC27B|nr:DUF3048 domain-containing protein [Sporosarcina sp. YIM B06819]
MTKKMRGLLFYLAIAMLLLAACSKEEKVEDPVPEPDEDEEIAEEEEPVEEVSVELFPSPFTGVMKEEENIRRPVLATINNHPLARPQSGISDADIIYELAAEGSVTRLLALFQSELPAEIGPIRSARDYFVHIAKGLDAFYVAHGYSPDAKQLLEKRVVDNVNGMQYDGTLFWRSRERRAPHNSYISGDNIVAAEEKTNSSMELSVIPPFAFLEFIEDAKIGDSVSSVTVKYSSDPNFTSVYAYDAEKGIYSRTVNGNVTVDKANDKQLELSNILVFETAHRTIDNVGRQAVDIESGGKAMLFQAGIAREIEWENRDGILVPMENGLPAKLVPGKTWIHIVPTKPGLVTAVTYMP